ncbi:MAG: aminomethyl-transferring glycine dehydrogenase subunit GcvPA [Candidatus Aminicenantes bacterium]|nr:aminomethyl-transferring glycine dehydrogenase subunit GcvPA [Candidatus Aminicenantes bacterium]
MGKKPFIHPYIPNSVPEVQKKMLEEIGAKDIEELYEDIPPELRLKRDLNLPEPLLSELELKRHVEEILNKNISCGERVSFLGGGCGRHYVPAICDEITHRSEFLTAYAGEPYEDAGRFQVLFEYESLMAEILDFDVVNVPTFDWGQAASTSVRMAGRITGRKKVLVADTVSPDRLAIIKNYCHPVMSVALVGHQADTGLLDMGDLKAKLSPETAAVYFENPSYLGFIETQGEAISAVARAGGALSLAGVDPLSLGVLKPPSQYGVDIACGDIQGLGNHMYFGGTLGGFIATRDEERFVMEYPSRLFGIAGTSVEGEWGFGDVAYSRTSFDGREKGKEFVGTAAALHGIAAAVYLSLMGPQGLRDLGRHILQKARYAALKLSGLNGVKIRFRSVPFKEFVVDFSGTGKRVAEINERLLEAGLFGGIDLTKEFPELRGCALYSFTEMTAKSDVDKLTETLRSILG